MKYVDFNTLNDKDFIILLQKLKKSVSIYDDPFVKDYKGIMIRIDRILRKTNTNINGYEIKSLELSKKFIKSLDSLYKLEEVVDNKNKLKQRQLNKIYNGLYIYEENKGRIFNCIGKRLTFIASHINNIDTIDNNNMYMEATVYIDKYYNGYITSKNKSKYLKDLYKEDSIDIDLLDKYFNILLDYYTKSIFNTKFMKVYEEYPMDKLHDIDKVINLYRFLLRSINEFLYTPTSTNIDIDFDMYKFIEEYNSYSRKEDFFSYLYAQYNITDTKLKSIINYFKSKYIEKFNTSYNKELNTLYKLDSIYDEYVKFINSLVKPNLIDKDIVEAYLNNKDIDYMFFELLNTNKIRKGKINNFYHGKLSEEEITKYSIIINFIDNRLLTISNNDIFRDRIILSNIKNKKLYYDYMNTNFYKRKYKPTSKYVQFDRRALTKEEMYLVDEYSNMYTEYYNSMVKENIRTNFVSSKEASEIVEPNIEELVGIVNKLMKCDSKYVILDFYKLSPYSVSIFFNIVKKYLNVNQKIFMSKFYISYKDDIAIDEVRRNYIIEKEKMRFGFDENNLYETTSEDKSKVIELLEEDNIPITNRTFNARLRKYFMDNKDTLLNNKVLVKK